MPGDWDIGRVIGNDFIVGALGATVGLKWVPGRTFIERVGNIVAGALCAGYFTPVLIDYLKLSGENARGAMAFSVGVFGLSVIAQIVEVGRAIDWSGIARRWFKRQG